MKRFTNMRVFCATFCLGLLTVVLLAAAYYVKPIVAKPLTNTVFVSEQVSPNQVRSPAFEGYATIIDLRPDGEAMGQPTSEEIKVAARDGGVAFVYIPVPHGDIPDSAVAALDKALADSPKPILMYCRSGRRAARTWSLVEASRPGGLGSRQILAAVAASGQSADDLRFAINARIEKRVSPAVAQ